MNSLNPRFVQLLTFFLCLSFVAKLWTNETNEVKPYSRNDLWQLDQTKKKVTSLRSSLPSDILTPTAAQEKVLKAIEAYNYGNDKVANLLFLELQLQPEQETNYEYVILKKLTLDDQSMKIFTTAVKQSKVSGVRIAALNRMASRSSEPKVRDLLVNVINDEHRDLMLESRSAEILIALNDEIALKAVAEYLLRTRKTKVFMENIVKKYYPEKVVRLQEICDVLDQTMKREALAPKNTK